MVKIRVNSNEMLGMIQKYYSGDEFEKLWLHILQNGFIFNEYTLVWNDVNYIYKVKLIQNEDDTYKVYVKKIYEYENHTHNKKILEFEIKDYLDNLMEALYTMKKTGKSAVEMMGTDFLDNTWASDVLPVMCFMQYVVYEAMNKKVVEVEATKKKYKPIAEREYRPKTNQVYKLVDVVYKYTRHINHSVRHMKCEYWEVKGHFRHYKNGKVTYVKPYTKGKGKGERPTIDREYRL